MRKLFKIPEFITNHINILKSGLKKYGFATFKVCAKEFME